MSALSKLKPTFTDQSSDQNVNDSNSTMNLTEEMPATFKLPLWMQANWFKPVKIGMCILCFPMIYVIGKFLVQLLK